MTILLHGKRVGDFGCGSGDFLRLCKAMIVKHVLGIATATEKLMIEGYSIVMRITCTNDLANVENKSLDILEIRMGCNSG